MKFDVRKTSDFEYQKQITIYSLEQLLDFCRKKGGDIIISIDATKKLPKIEIYDDWRE